MDERLLPVGPSIARRIQAMELPERAEIAAPNVRQADLAILAETHGDFLDTTHFDTVRFPPPDWAHELFARAAADGSLAYTGYRGHPEVLEDLATKVSKFIGHEVDPKRNLILTPGTQAALFVALAARVDPGDRVVVMDPDYLFSARILRFLGADVGYAPLRLNDGCYEPDLDLIETEFRDRNARHLVFSHPNNPTGAVFSRETIAAIAELVVRFGVSVVADELYSRLLYTDRPFPHVAAEPGAFEHVATLLGPSKTELLSGYRIGVLVGDDPLMRAAENVMSILSLRAPAYAQHVLKGWLGPDSLWLVDRIEAFRSLRAMTIGRLGQVPWMKIHPQEGTAYLWADLRALERSDVEIGKALARDAKMLISPGYQFGPASAGHIRICYARDEKQWSQAMDTMTATLEALVPDRVHAAS